MTGTSLRPLPVLTPDPWPPSSRAWDALRAAKTASGYPGLIIPRQAVQGSPEPVLAVGVEPDWLTKFVYIDSLYDHDALVHAMQVILVWDDGSTLGEERLLSKWMGCNVKLIGVENG